MHHRFAVLSAIFLVVLAHTGAILLDLPPPRLGDGNLLAGPDAYMRLHLVENLWRTGDWYDYKSYLTNAPFGESFHWTRPLDVLLIGGAWPLSGILSEREALFAWGTVISPVLQVLLVLVFSWGLKPFLSTGAFLLLVVLMILQPSLYNAFMAARPDHQSLQILLFGLSFVILFRVLAEKSPPRFATLAGAVSGFALWVSVEAQLPIAVALITLGLLWLWEGGEHARAIGRYLTGVTLVAGVGLMVEQPPSLWFTPQLVKISIVYVALFAGLAIVWRGIASLSLSGGGTRLLAGAAGVVLPTLVLFLVYPQYFQGPFAGVDKKIWEIHFSAIREFQPLMPEDFSSAGTAFFVLGPVLWGLMFSIRSVLGRDTLSRAAGLYLLVGLLVFTALALYQIRWSHYAVMLMVIAWVMLLTALWRWTGTLKMGNLKLPLRTPLVAGALAGHVAISGIFFAVAEASPPAPPRQTFSWQKMVAPLQLRAAAQGEQLTLMSFTHNGPEIVYRTGFSVVGAPYLGSGIFDTYAVMSAVDSKKARNVLQRREVDFIVYCRSAVEAPRFLGMNGDTLFKRLYRHDPPPWLKEERLEGPGVENFQLFKVVIPR